MNLRFLFLIFLGFLSTGISQNLNKNTTLEEVYQWKYVDYEYDSQERKDEILKNGNYSKSKILITNFYLVPDGRTFVTLNKNDKSPVTLATVSKNQSSSGPLLTPYPNWQWHVRKDCFGIYRATSIQTDTCNSNRLWILDNGTDDNKTQVCQPQLLIFDLKKNRLIARYSIPRKFAQGSDGKGRLLRAIVETSGWWCGTTKIYMSYYETSAILVWNGRKFWRISGPNPKDLVGPLAVANKYIPAPGGIFGFALSPKIDNNPQFIAMSSLGSFHVFTAKIDDILASEPKVGFFKWLFSPIRNLFKRGKSQENDTTIEITRHEYRMPNPSAAFAFDSRGILYVGVNAYISLACANTAKSTANKTDVPYFTVIDSDPKKLQFVSGAYTFNSSVTKGKEEELWILTNRYLDFVYDALNLTDINYRIMKQSVKKLTDGTKCA
ncbi:major royal jelly protein 2-like [Leptopilina boulardi]|uniref:major royal jelly protein 2-like n=1 Tax=Leptopilina boulardi TaxID=63433 RepID=UPI0021F58E06|nr:major royal jelly protein 2-like [Leptopilina boulardi]